MGKPSDKPALNKTTDKSCGKLLRPEETPFHVRDVMKVARDCGQQLAEHEWNNFIKFVSDQNLLKDREYSGNDFVSLMMTFAAYFTTTWVILIKQMIVNKDDTVITQDQLINDISEAMFLIVRGAQFNER